jgi:hypothetical protein
MMRQSGVVAIAALYLAASCASDDAVIRARSLKRGDSRARALQLLGEPRDAQSEDDDEVLQYCKAAAPPWTTDSAGYASVWLYRGAVTGVTTYRRSLKGTPSCATGFKAIHWEDAPDRVAGALKP